MTSLVTSLPMRNIATAQPQRLPSSKKHFPAFPQIPMVIGAAWEKWRALWHQQVTLVKQVESMDPESPHFPLLCSLVLQTKCDHCPLAHAITNLFRKQTPERLDQLLRRLVEQGVTTHNSDLIEKVIALVPLGQLSSLSEMMQLDLRNIEKQVSSILRHFPCPPDSALSKQAKEEVARLWNQILPFFRQILETVVMAINLPDWSEEVEPGWRARSKLYLYYEWLSLPLTLFTGILAATNNRSLSAIGSAAILLVSGLTLYVYYRYFRLCPSRIGNNPNLTTKALQGMYESILDRRGLTDHLESSCSGPGETMRHVLLVGRSGVGKSTLVEAFAQRIATAKKGDPLKGKKIFQLDPDDLRRGTTSQCQDLINRIAGHADKYLFFVDEIHSLCDPKNNSPAIQSLKPILARNDLHLIGATTDREFKQLEAEPEFLNRFNIINVPGMGENEARTLLHNYWKKHAAEIVVQAGAWDAILKVSLIPEDGTINPRTAMNLLNRAIQKIRLARDAKPEALQLLENRLSDCSLKYAQECLHDLKKDNDRLVEITTLETEVVSAKESFEKEKLALQAFDALRRQKPFWERKLYAAMRRLKSNPKGGPATKEFLFIRHRILPALNATIEREIESHKGEPITITQQLIEQLVPKKEESKEEPPTSPVGSFTAVAKE